MKSDIKMKTELKKSLNKNKMSKNSSLLGFALAGMAAGAAAWYLFGTKDGRKSLSKAIDGINELSSTIKEKASEGLECASDFADKAKDKAKKKFEEGKRKFSDISDQVSDASDEIKKKGNRLKDDAEDLGRKAARGAEDLATDAKNKMNDL